jgi:DNA-binding response OmpR family regulator
MPPPHIAGTESCQGAHILLIDDDVVAADIVSTWLRQEGYPVDIAYTGVAGLSLASIAPYRLAVVELTLPDIGGIEVIKAIRLLPLAFPAMVITKHITVASTVQAIKAGAFDVIEKPVGRYELIAAVRSIAPLHPSQDSPPSAIAEADICTRIGTCLLKNPRATLPEIARVLRADRHVIVAAVRHRSGLSYRRWRLDLTMRRAGHFLRLTDAPVKSIAYDFGYSSQRAFSRAFTSVFGVSPRQFKNSP